MARLRLRAIHSVARLISGIPASRNTPRARFFNAASVWAVFPVCDWFLSSFQVTSRHQWIFVSMPQWFRVLVWIPSADRISGPAPVIIKANYLLFACRSRS
ncbi:MAG: hypothetical protein QG671_774 [Actinomycetota bacterium]|nr:hypothetical protein [Actinomycetota bacterium]